MTLYNAATDAGDTTVLQGYGLRADYCSHTPLANQFIDTLNNINKVGWMSDPVATIGTGGAISSHHNASSSQEGFSQMSSYFSQQAIMEIRPWFEHRLLYLRLSNQEVVEQLATEIGLQQGHVQSGPPGEAGSGVSAGVHGGPMAGQSVLAAGPSNPVSPTARIDDLIKDYLRKMASCNVPANQQQISLGRLPCTGGCSQRFDRPDDWRRHESRRQPQEIWICVLCREDAQCGSHQWYITQRKDHMKQHLKDMHMKAAAQVDDAQLKELVNRSKITSFVGRFERECTHCDHQFFNWRERCDHIMGHFPEGPPPVAPGTQLPLPDPDLNGIGAHFGPDQVLLGEHASPYISLDQLVEDGLVPQAAANLNPGVWNPASGRSTFSPDDESEFTFAFPSL